MRLLSAILLLSAAVTVLSRRSFAPPRVLSIQVNRCPTPDTYSNDDEEQEFKHRSANPSDKVQIASEFEETLRFMANESGTIQFFVVGRGNFSVEIQSDENVISGLNGVHKVDGRQGGAVITLPFKVVQGVRETVILVTLTTRTIVKTTSIYASTKSLEPPRPPSLHTSWIYSPGVVPPPSQNGSTTDDLGPFPDLPHQPTTPIKSMHALTNITFSLSTIHYTSPPGLNHEISSSLRITSVALNRLTKDTTDFYGEQRFYSLTIKKGDKGQMIFMVSGNGKKTVWLKSFEDKRRAWVVLEVEGDYAALKYEDGPDYVDEDKIVAVLVNDLGEATHIYIYVVRVD